jgi:zinc transport system substrate-binding protein
VSVVASIKPVQSLAAALMEGAGTPALLVDGASSPHGYSLKPSQAHLLEHADIVFWIGPDLEQFLVKPLTSIGRQADSVALEEAPGVVLYDPREGGTFEPDDHGNAEGDHHDGEHHGGHDPHIWLDPFNAIAMARQIAATLSEDDPANAALYQANLARLEKQLNTLIASVQKQLAPLSGRQFIVFHDAYRYFEERFGVHAAGSITIHPDVAPGAERIRQIRKRIGELDTVCVFAEPQFPPAMVRVVTEGTVVKAAVLDPLGSNIDSGPDLYAQLIEGLANTVSECLSSNAQQQ